MCLVLLRLLAQEIEPGGLSDDEFVPDILGHRRCFSKIPATSSLFRPGRRYIEFLAIPAHLLDICPVSFASVFPLSLLMP
jgi:hypothetical protein